jgi:hypothetical protein
MKFREITLFNGESYVVPQCIQRIDKGSTHGWQVRYHGTKMYSDHTSDGSGARKALTLATKDLLNRIDTMDAPVMLKVGPSSHKQNNLPPGISGPIVSSRRGSRGRSASLSVLLPTFGEPPRITSIYIGSESTYTLDRYKAALERALDLRSEAVEQYGVAATKARRKEAAEVRKVMREKFYPR